jgi:hypothetical protein
MSCPLYHYRKFNGVPKLKILSEKLKALSIDKEHES